MHWAIFVIAAAVLNALLNYGYKLYARHPGIYYLYGCVMALTAVLLLAYSTLVLGEGPGEGFSSNMLALGIAMGLANPFVFSLMFKAFAKAGPLSLVDPMWACLYSLTSVLVGVILAGENPSLPALGGIALYLAGAFLMAKGRA